MKTFQSLVLASIFAVGLGLAAMSAAGEEAAKPAAAEKAPATGTKPLRVLFIGNSLTATGNIPAAIQHLAAAAKESRPLEFERVILGGATFEKHLENGKALKYIQKGNWDFVVLNEMSTRALREREPMFKAGRKLIEEIKKVNAKPVIYMTWALKEKPAEFAAVIANCRDLGKETGAAVVPVGVAWQTIVKNNPEIDLYTSDGKHPRLEGSYLAACTFYGFFYGKPSAGLTSEFTLSDPHADAKPHEYKIPAEVAAKLQKAADEAMKAEK